MTQSDSQALARILSFNEIVFICLSTVLGLGLSVMADRLGFWLAWESVIGLNIVVLMLITAVRRVPTSTIAVSNATENGR